MRLKWMLTSASWRMNHPRSCQVLLKTSDHYQTLRVILASTEWQDCYGEGGAEDDPLKDRDAVCLVFTPFNFTSFHHKDLSRLLFLLSSNLTSSRWVQIVLLSPKWDQRRKNRWFYSNTQPKKNSFQQFFNSTSIHHVARWHNGMISKLTELQRKGRMKIERGPNTWTTLRIISDYYWRKT